MGLQESAMTEQEHTTHIYVYMCMYSHNCWEMSHYIFNNWENLFLNVHHIKKVVGNSVPFITGSPLLSRLKPEFYIQQHIQGESFSFQPSLVNLSILMVLNGSLGSRPLLVLGSFAKPEIPTSFHRVLWASTSLRSWDLPGAWEKEDTDSTIFSFLHGGKSLRKPFMSFKLLKPNAREWLRFFFLLTP